MRLLRFIVMVFMISLLMSCVNREIEDCNIHNELYVTAVSSVTTKAPIAGTTFPVTRKMIISAYNRVTKEDYFVGALFSYSTEKSAWHTVPKQFWPFDTPLNMLAYSCEGIVPSSVVWKEDNSAAGLTLIMPDNSVIQDDYLMGQKLKATESSASITFSHPQSQVCFTASSNTPFNAETNAGISIRSITLKDAYNAGTIKGNPTREGQVSYEWQDLASKKDVTVTASTPVTLSDEHQAVGVGYLLPPQYATSFTVKYVIHNGRDAASNAVDIPMEYTYTPEVTLWQAGRKYCYAMNFSIEGVSVIPSLIDWDAVPISSDI